MIRHEDCVTVLGEFEFDGVVWLAQMLDLAKLGHIDQKPILVFERKDGATLTHQEDYGELCRAARVAGVVT